LNEAAIRSEAKRSDLRKFPVFHDLIASNSRLMDNKAATTPALLSPM
jgi:hypothetical protein